MSNNTCTKRELLLEICTCLYSVYFNEAEFVDIIIIIDAITSIQTEKLMPEMVVK